MFEKIVGYTRCPDCGIRLGYTDEYPEDRFEKGAQKFYDPDWVVSRHLRLECVKR